MNPLDVTRSYINEKAKERGFQRDTLEKVVRLYYVLKDMSEIPLLRDNLALKGGTAINLAYFNLPRLSYHKYNIIQSANSYYSYFSKYQL